MTGYKWNSPGFRIALRVHVPGTHLQEQISNGKKKDDLPVI